MDTVRWAIKKEFLLEECFAAVAGRASTTVR
jgi:hypothetical protein